MKIAVVGGGFTGLAASYELTKNGHEVTLFEAGKTLGGLAYGFKQNGWRWHLEYAYHHWFTNDSTVREIIKELGLTSKIIIKRPVTASLFKGEPYQLDSPMHLLRFPGLSILDKARTATLLGFLKLTPFWKPLEGFTAKDMLLTIGGQRAYQVLWEPLLVGKFGDYASRVSAAWFWARIKKRTPHLMYIEGGFHTLVTALASAITKQGGIIKTGQQLTSIPKGFDRVLITTPSPVAKKLAPEITVPNVPHLWAQTLILETNKPILDRVYWLNITDRSFPFLAAVAHTNFMDPRHYGGHHLTYLGNYLPAGHRYLAMNKDALLKVFTPHLMRLTKAKFSILRSFLFVGPFAQPVHERHYSDQIPPIKTPVPGVFFANMDFVVPWDRGTNYALELGIRSARIMMK